MRQPTLMDHPEVQIGIVLGLVALLLFLFFREVLPIPITAILAAVVLGATGILTPAQALSGFSSEATVAVLAMFVLSAGIERTGAVDLLTRALQRWSGKSERRQILSLGTIAGGLSGFVNNTPVVAVMAPAASHMARQSGRSPSKLLMPVSFFAMMGGTLTLIGTSTNLLGNALLGDLGVAQFGMFSFFLVGLAALATCVLYFLTIGRRLLPDRGDVGFVERFDLKGFIAEFEAPPEAEVAGQSLEEAGLVWAKGIQVIRVVRGSAVHDAPPRTFRLQTGDQLLVEGSRERLGGIPQATGLAALPEILHPLQGPEEGEEDELMTAEVVITTGSRYVGKSVAEIDFRNRYEALVLAVRHQGRVVIGPLDKAPLGPGDVLLVRATPKALERMREKPDLYVTRERKPTEYRRNRMPFALASLVAVVLVATLTPVSIAVAALGGAVALVLLRCLNIEEFMRSIQWDIILLLAGIIPLGIALQESGAADILARGVVGLGVQLHPVAFLVLLFVFTSLITSVVSNNASVVLLIPIAVAASLSLGLDPRPVALTVILASSTSLITPIGYQTNTMIYAPGGYRFSDYMRVGGPLNLALAFVIPFTIVRLFPL